MKNIKGKGENAGKQHFLPSPQCFSTIKKGFQFLNHIYFLVCKCFQIGPAKILLFCKELRIFECFSGRVSVTTVSFTRQTKQRNEALKSIAGEREITNNQ